MRQQQYTSPYDPSQLTTIIDAVESHWREGFNPEQDAFARDITQKLIGLQGPPGTGKTYTVAPAAVGRALSYRGPPPFTGVVSAYAHDAVDEVLDDANDVLETLRDAGALPAAIRLLRVHPSEIPAGSEQIRGDFIEHYNYNAHRDVLADLFEEHLEDGENTPIMVFSPPATVRGLVHRLARDDVLEGDNAEAVIQAAEDDGSLFEYALIDEASMMDLPLLFLIGAFVTEMGQVQLAGDHRQLPPIQQHDWRDEDRRTVEHHTPELSALDMVRFLRDELDNVDYLSRSPPSITNVDQEVPMHRLETTYRLPEPIANLLSRLIYHPGDGIILDGRPEANVDRLPEVTQGDVVTANTTTDENDEVGLPYALDRSSRLALVIHKDDRATDINPVEEALVGAMTDELPIVPANRAGGNDLTGGVVVPYRRQRATLQERVDDAYEVDTVERFQGGERSVMFISMTASDPGAVYRGADFLLDPRRFCVAVSRMKRKAVLVASETMFQTVPTDLEKFEDQSIWLRLYNEMDIPSRRPDWAGTVETFVGDDVLGRPDSVGVEVYNSMGFSEPDS